MYVNVSFKVIFYYLQYIFVKVLSTFNNISENSISVIALILSVNFIISKKTWIFVQIKKKKHSTNEVCFGQKVLNKYRGVNWIN